MSTTNNFFRPKRHFRSVFREGKFLLNTEATEIELEVLDRLREQIRQAYGPTFSIQNGMLVEADTVVGRVIIRPGYSYVDGYPVSLASSEDPRFALGSSPTPFTAADFVKMPKTVLDNGGIALNLGGGTPVDAGSYIIILETREELITAAQDPYLRSANLSESTADRHRLIVDVHIIPKYIGNNIINGLNLNNSPIPYRGSGVSNLVDYVQITPSGSNYALVSTLPITGAETIDGRNVEIQINNGNGTTTAAFPTSNDDIKEFIHGKLIDSNGTEFHISNMFVTPGNSTRVTIQLDLEKTRPVQLTTFQSNPVITDLVPYRLVKRDLFVTSSGQLPEGKRFYPLAEVVWNGTTVTNANITDLRPKLLAKDGVLDLIRNEGLNLTSDGATFWNMTTGDLVWGSPLKIHSAFEGFDWTVAANNTISLFGGMNVDDVLYVKLSDAPTGGSLTLYKGQRGVGELTQSSLRASSIFWIAKRLSDNRIYFNSRLVLNDLQTGYFHDVPEHQLLPQDILTLGYSAMFDDRLESPSAFSLGVCTGEFFANSWMLNYNNRTITVAGNNVTWTGNATFTLVIGDIISQGSSYARITSVVSQTSVVVDNGAVLTTATNATISQVVETLNLRLVDDGGGSIEQINSYMTSPVNKMLVRYDDNIIQSLGNLPRLAYSVTANGGTNWTGVNLRPQSLADTVTEVTPTVSGSDVRLRFFSAVTTGDGISVLESFRSFFHTRSFVGTLVSSGSSTTSGARPLEFRVYGLVENPVLEPTGAPTYNVATFNMTSAVLVIENGQIGTFNIEIVSYNADGTSPTVHVTQSIVLASAGSSVVNLSFSNTTIAAGKVVKLLTQYVSGGITSNIAVVLS